MCLLRSGQMRPSGAVLPGGRPPVAKGLLGLVDAPLQSLPDGLRVETASVGSQARRDCRSVEQR